MESSRFSSHFSSAILWKILASLIFGCVISHINGAATQIPTTSSGQAELSKELPRSGPSVAFEANIENHKFCNALFDPNRLNVTEALRIITHFPSGTSIGECDQAQDGTPILHHLLNLYRLIQDPSTKNALVNISLRCIELGADPNKPYGSDPPLMFKAMLIREMELVEVVTLKSAPYLQDLLLTESDVWIRKFLHLLYALPSEVVPISKLLLHADKISASRQSGNSSTPAGSSSGESVEQLLASAVLGGQASVKPRHLALYSETYKGVAASLGLARSARGAASEAGVSGIRLLDVIRMLDEVASAAHHAFLRAVLGIAVVGGSSGGGANAQIAAASGSEVRGISTPHDVAVSAGGISDWTHSQTPADQDTSGETDHRLLRLFHGIGGVADGDPTGRTALHGLCMSGAARMLLQLNQLLLPARMPAGTPLHSHQPHAPDGSAPDEPSSVQCECARIFGEALLRQDYRGHSPLSYALMRFRPHSSPSPATPLAPDLAPILDALRTVAVSLRQVAAGSSCTSSSKLVGSRNEAISTAINAAAAAVETKIAAASSPPPPPPPPFYSLEAQDSEEAGLSVPHSAVRSTGAVSLQQASSEGGGSSGGDRGGDGGGGWACPLDDAHNDTITYHDGATGGAGVGSVSAVCDVQEVWGLRELPSNREFFEQFANSGKPVVFRQVGRSPPLTSAGGEGGGQGTWEEVSSAQGNEPSADELGADGSRDPTVRSAQDTFLRERFLQRYGQYAVPSSTIPYAGSFGVESKVCSLAQVAESLCATSSSSSMYGEEAGATQRQGGAPKPMPMYTFCTPSAAWSRRLLQDVSLPRPIRRTPTYYPNPNSAPSVTSTTSSAGADPEWGWDSGVGAVDPEWKSWSFEVQFYLGPRHSGAPVHYHGHAINTLAYGEKRWALYPPDRALYSSTAAIDFFEALDHHIDGDATFAAFAEPLQCTQHAGDILYVPALWGHATLNTQPSIGVAHEFSIESFCME